MFKWLLFDADNTLLDFAAASRQAFWRLFEEYGLACDEEKFVTYKQINKQAWQDFEKGKISAERLRLQRFERFFQAIGIRGTDPAKANSRFLHFLVESTTAYAGSVELVKALGKRYRISLVTNGLREVQRPRLDRVKLTPLFESIVVSDEVGVAKPDPAYFEVVFGSVVAPPARSEVLIIGDNLSSDIRGGRDYGIKTCWISHGRTNRTDIRPDFEIDSVLELKTILPEG